MCNSYSAGTDLACGACTMINILGEGSGREGAEIANKLIGRSLPVAGAYPHWYGKEGVKPGRKIGHITITGSSLQVRFLHYTTRAITLSFHPNFLSKK